VTETDRSGESKELSRELSAFLVQLSVGLHKYGTYPKGHPIIQNAAGAVFTALQALLKTRDALVLGVARDQLLVEGSATDPGTVVHRDLAQRLHRHQVAGIRFQREIAPEELVEFLQVVSTEANRQEMPFGLRSKEEIDRWRHIEVVPATFEHLHIGEGGAEDADDGRITQLWLGLASAALRKGRAGDVVSQDPAEIAKAIDGRADDPAYDAIVVGYLEELGRELRVREGESLVQLQSRVTQLLSSLDPRTVTRLLNVGGGLGARQELVSNFASSLPVGAVLDLVQAAAAAQQQNISHSLLRMLTKLAEHAGQEQTTVSSRADETFRAVVRDLLRGWTLADPNPENYTLVLDRLSLPAAVEVEVPVDDEHLTESPRIVRMAVELDVMSEAVVRALGVMVREGRLEEVVQVLDGAPEGSEAVPALWSSLAGPELLGVILEHGDAHIDAVDRILQRSGASAIGPMLDALAQTESRSIRHRLLAALSAVGPLAGPPAVARLHGAEWFVQRNLLIVLGALDEWPPDFDPGEYATADDPRVRREAVKLMLAGTQRPELRADGLMRSLADPDDSIMRLGLAAALESCPGAAERLVAQQLDHADVEVRVLAIRVLGTLRSRRARELLVQRALARRRWWSWRHRLNPPTPETVAAVRGLLATWARHPDAKLVLDLATRSNSPDLRNAAGLA
jgi:HEAT repeat protein